MYQFYVPSTTMPMDVDEQLQHDHDQTSFNDSTLFTTFREPEPLLDDDDDDYCDVGDTLMDLQKDDHDNEDDDQEGTVSTYTTTSSIATDCWDEKDMVRLDRRLGSLSIGSSITTLPSPPSLPPPPSTTPMEEEEEDSVTRAARIDRVERQVWEEKEMVRFYGSLYCPPTTMDIDC